MTQQPRRDVAFSSGEERCAAWLYLPEGASADNKVPVIVMAHGLGGVRRARLDAFAERFVAAGYACLVFDYRHFGDSTGMPRELLRVHLQREDYRAAIAYARKLEEVDPDRVVLWGTSFSGGHVIFAAAEDHRVAAAIAQCPFTDGIASVLAINPITSSKLTALALKDVAGAARGQDPVRVPLTGAPGEVALMTAPDAKPGYDAVLGSAGYDVPQNMAARVALDVLRARPGAKAKSVQCPILFAVCKPDSVAPSKATLRHVRKAPKGEIKLYDAGHFDIYVGDDFEMVLADELAFLAEHVPVN
jgi:pimeloyl-ACP methyl ester carboxylesterase